MTDEELHRSVADELFWDPAVDSEAITVSVHDGVVTLRGTAGSVRRKRAAATAAERVCGVVSVDNELRVRTHRPGGAGDRGRDGRRRDDAGRLGDVLRALTFGPPPRLRRA